MVTAVREIWVAVVAGRDSRRHDLQHTLATDGEITVVPVNGTGTSAVTAVMGAASTGAGQRAAVVVDATGLEIREMLALIESIATPPESPGIVVVGVGGEVAIEALMRGAAGVVARDATPTELCEAIRVVTRGEAAVPPDVTTALVARLQRLDPRD